MEKDEKTYSEEWIKIINIDIPDGRYIVTSLVQDLHGTKISLDDEEHFVEIFFDGIPILVRDTVEGMRMRTYSNAQLKYNDRYMFSKSFFFEVKNSELVKWCVQESCGCYEENELRHFCIITMEELIDIVATFEPTVKRLK